jgi:hypothetical protein
MRALSAKQLMAQPVELLVDMILALRDDVAQLTQEVAELSRLCGQIEPLKTQVAALQLQLRDKISAKAPFSKGKSQAVRKPPGRREGEGLFTRKQEPQPRPSDQVTALDASLDIDQRRCPDCKEPLVTTQELATIEDTPKQPVRQLTYVNVEVGVCPICGKKIRAEHELLNPSQSGANAHQLGLEIKAQALALHYYQGVPMRKVPAILEQSTGIKITQSAINQLAIRLTAPGAVMDAVYTQLREELVESPSVNSDDTGWRIGLCLAFVMGFFTSQIAYYQIRLKHRHQEVIEVLGEYFAGILITDRGSSYCAQALLSWLKQKCLAHLLKNCSQVHHTKKGRAREFTATLMELMREAIALWHEVTNADKPMDRLGDYLPRVAALEQKLDEHLRPRTVSDADNQRLLDGIGEVHRRGELTQFLRKPDEVEPTNNRAERGLRSAVIARKVSQCSKNERGSHAYAVLKSVFCTLELRTKDPVGAFTDLLRGQPLPKAA